MLTADVLVLERRDRLLVHCRPSQLARTVSPGAGTLSPNFGLCGDTLGGSKLRVGQRAVLMMSFFSSR